MSEPVLRLFVSSPGDVAGERRRIDLVVERLNAEFAGRVRIETVRWELSFYSAHDTFQRQIPEAAECDVVVAVFRSRLGTPLPAAFPTLPTGEPYPSGTAYEILSAIEVRRGGKRVPDVYVFRYPNAPTVELDAPDRAEIETQWGRLKTFFDRWFRTPAGEFVAAFQTYTSTDDFAAKVEECLRQWLAQRGYAAQGPVWDRVLHGSPFPGLAAFEADRGRVFFGRDLAIRQALERLRVAGFLLLIGASGSGKSSLLRAGVMPQLVLPGAVPEVDLWRIAVITPGADPFAALAEALFMEGALGAELRAGTFRTRELLARQLASDPDIAAAPLRDAIGRAGAERQAQAGFDAPRPVRLALGIDQAERLFTEASPAAAGVLARLLANLVRNGLATVVMALRSDAYAQFQGVEALVALREAGATLDLVPPTAAELEEIVTRPVAACAPKLAFEAGLAGRLVADARGGDALPLLQVSLARLSAAEAARDDGLLRHADYSGMDEAVTQTANEALAAVDAAARAELPALVAGLVADVATDPFTGAATPVVAALDRHAFEAENPARAALVGSFVAKRLLTAEGAQDGEGGRTLVRPVHEALLRIWPEAVAIVAETASLIRVRHTLAPLVRSWLEAEEKAGHLDLSPALLDGAQALLARFGADLPPAMRDFIAQAAAADAARRDRERAEQERRIRDAEALAAARRRIARRTLAGAAAAVLLAVLAGWQWHEAGQQRDRAQHSMALATETANGLVFDLAEKFRDVVGVPTATIKDILARAEQLQDQLIASGKPTPELRASQADALLEESATLRTLGDSQGALAAAKQASALLQALFGGPIDPRHDYAYSFELIGQSEEAQGDKQAALADYMKSLDIRKQTAAAKPNDMSALRDVGSSYDLIGNFHHGMGQDDKAAEAYAAAEAIARTVQESDPANPVWLHDLSISQNKLALVHQSRGELVEALAGYRSGLAMATQLSQSLPDNVRYRLDRVAPLMNIGDVQISLGDTTAALDAYHEAQAILQSLAKADAGSAEVKRVLPTQFAGLYDRMAAVQQATGDLPAGLASLQAELAVKRGLEPAVLATPVVQHEVAGLLGRIGKLQAALKDWSGAVASDQAAIAILEPLAAAHPEDAAWLHEIAVIGRDLAGVFQAKGERDQADPVLRQGQSIMQKLSKDDPANPAYRDDTAWFDQQLAAGPGTP